VKFVASGTCFALAAAVLLPGVARGVVAVAVQLYGQPPCRPATVHSSTTCRAIGLGRKLQPVFAQPLEEPPFELAERDVDVAVKDSAQPLRSGAVRSAHKHASTAAGVVR
jgi:hypothetical protein